jgi:hypothetical protein
MNKLSWILLWLLVVMLGVEIGAGIYEARVLVPLWAGAPPDSVWDYLTQELRPDPGRKFWAYSTTLVGLLGIANLVTAWRNKKIPSKQRKWWLLGAGGTVAMIIATFAYFVPTLMRMEDAGQAMVSADVVNWWVRLNWLRAAVYMAAWLATLRAFSFGRISGG